MKLYHGTSAKAADQIRTKGIKPRSYTRANSAWTNPESLPDFTYFTDIYGAYYAMCSDGHEGDDKAIVEIDFGALSKHKLYPDDQYLVQGSFSLQSIRDKYGLEGKSTEAVFAYFQANLEDFKPIWRPCLQHLGLVAYKGIVPANAITRIAYFNANENPYIAAEALDPTISAENHYHCSSKYDALTRWIFGETISFEEWEQVTHANRMPEEVRANNRGPALEMLGKRNVKIVSCAQQLAKAV